MKEKLTDEIKSIFSDSKEWITLQIEYTKLTAAEKMTILGGAITLGAICLLIGVVILFVLALSLIDTFKLFMAPALACLAVSGCLIILMVILVIFKKPLILNPIAKFLTKLFLN